MYKWFLLLFIISASLVSASDKHMAQKQALPQLRHTSLGVVVSCVPATTPHSLLMARMKADAALLEARQGQRITSSKERRVRVNTEHGTTEQYTSTVTANAQGESWGVVVSQWQEEGLECLEVRDRLAAN